MLRNGRVFETSAGEIDKAHYTGIGRPSVVTPDSCGLECTFCSVEWV
jgi:hypothetical protein